MLEQLKQVVIAVLSKIAELKKELADALAKPPVGAEELAAAKARAEAAEAKVTQLEDALATLQSEDAAEDGAISEVLTQLSTALAN